MYWNTATVLSFAVLTDEEVKGGTDGQADMTKLIAAFCNFANAPKNSSFSQSVNLRALRSQNKEQLISFHNRDGM